MMRHLINIVTTPLFEKVRVMSIPSGWCTLSGPINAIDLRVWENPVRTELEAAVHANGVMDGDPNLRGFAHAGKVYIWAAHEATHDAVMSAMGVNEKTIYTNLGEDELQFDYKRTDYCFFQVWGSRWVENPDIKILISYNGVGDNLSVLKATSARGWRVQYHNGGSWMGRE